MKLRRPISPTSLFMAAVDRSATLTCAAGLFLAVVGCKQPEPTASFEIPPIPAIAANGSYVGIAEVGGVFYRNVSPGHYQTKLRSRRPVWT
jgi:hypothetical protein